MMYKSNQASGERNKKKKNSEGARETFKEKAGGGRGEIEWRERGKRKEKGMKFV